MKNKTRLLRAIAITFLCFISTQLLARTKTVAFINSTGNDSVVYVELWGEVKPKPSRENSTKNISAADSNNGKVVAPRPRYARYTKKEYVGDSARKEMSWPEKDKIVSIAVCVKGGAPKNYNKPCDDDSRLSLVSDKDINKLNHFDRTLVPPALRYNHSGFGTVFTVDTPKG